MLLFSLLLLSERSMLKESEQGDVPWTKSVERDVGLTYETQTGAEERVKRIIKATNTTTMTTKAVLRRTRPVMETRK